MIAESPNDEKEKFEFKDGDNVDELISQIEHALDSVTMKDRQQEEIKLVDIPIEFAFYREKDKITSEYQDARVVGLGQHSFRFESIGRVMVNSVVKFHGSGGKKFEGSARVFEVTRGEKAYLCRAMYMDINIGDGREHRRHERADRQLPFAYLIKKGEPLRKGYLLDISRSGLRFKSRLQVKSGMVVVIVMQSAAGDELSKKIIRPAKVVWVKVVKDGYEVGASFLEGDKGG